MRSELFKPQHGKFSGFFGSFHFFVSGNKSGGKFFRSKYASIVSRPLQEPLKDKRDMSFDDSANGVTETSAFPVGTSRETSKSRCIRRLAGISTVCVMVIRRI